jgi:hypothetical protein
VAESLSFGYVTELLDVTRQLASAVLDAFAGSSPQRVNTNSDAPLPANPLGALSEIVTTDLGSTSTANSKSGEVACRPKNRSGHVYPEYSLPAPVVSNGPYDIGARRVAASSLLHMSPRLNTQPFAGSGSQVKFTPQSLRVAFKQVSPSMSVHRWNTLPSHDDWPSTLPTQPSASRHVEHFGVPLLASQLSATVWPWVQSLVVFTKQPSEFGAHSTKWTPSQLLPALRQFVTPLHGSKPHAGGSAAALQKFLPGSRVQSVRVAIEQPSPSATQ